MRILNSLTPHRLADCSLILLAFFPVVYGFDLTFWELVRLGALTVGIAWLLLKRVPLLASSSGTDPLYRTGLLSLTFMFIISQFVGPERASDWALGLTGLMVGVAALGIGLSQSDCLLFSKMDGFVAGAGGIAVLISVLTQVVLGPEGGQDQAGIERWMGVFYILELMVVYFAVSRLFRMQAGERSAVRLLGVVAVAFAVVCLMGAYRTAAAFYYSNRAVASLEEGAYHDVWAYADRLSSVGSSLQFGPTSLDWTLENMMDAVSAKTGGEALVLVGKVAERYGLWARASAAYRTALSKDPDYPAIHAHLGNSLFEQGRGGAAVDIYQKGVRRVPPNIEDELAFGVGLARMGQWGEAKQFLDRAAKRGGLTTDIPALFAPGQRVVREPLRSFLPANFLPYAEKLTLLGIVRLLEQRGYAVLHPAMKIGSTGVTTPVDIVARGAAGSAFAREYIEIDGKQVSPKRRGYNVAVIHPETGQIEAIDNFDTWENLGEGHQLQQFMNAVPRGKIVVVTINDNGSGGLSGHSKAALQKIGVARFPFGWMSHAAVGVKGAAVGSALEVLGHPRKLALVGVLAANVRADVVEDQTKLEALLLERAGESRAGVALFLPSLDPDATVVIVRHGELSEK